MRTHGVVEQQAADCRLPYVGWASNDHLAQAAQRTHSHRIKDSVSDKKRLSTRRCQQAYTGPVLARGSGLSSEAVQRVVEVQIAHHRRLVGHVHVLRLAGDLQRINDQQLKNGRLV